LGLQEMSANKHKQGRQASALQSFWQTAQNTSSTKVALPPLKQQASFQGYEHPTHTLAADPPCLLHLLQQQLRGSSRF
jgi:hypothetical protein